VDAGSGADDATQQLAVPAAPADAPALSGDDSAPPAAAVDSERPATPVPAGAELVEASERRARTRQTGGGRSRNVRTAPRTGATGAGGGEETAATGEAAEAGVMVHSVRCLASEAAFEPSAPSVHPASDTMSDLPSLALVSPIAAPVRASLAPASRRRTGGLPVADTPVAMDVDEASSGDMPAAPAAGGGVADEATDAVAVRRSHRLRKSVGHVVSPAGLVFKPSPSKRVRRGGRGTAPSTPGALAVQTTSDGDDAMAGGAPGPAWAAEMMRQGARSPFFVPDAAV